MLRAEFLDVRIQVFPNYDSFLMDQYYDISNSFLKLNLRVSLYGLFNGTLVVNDADNIIKNTGDLIFLITIVDQKVSTPTIYMMGTTHNDMTLMQNGDVVRTYNLVAYHNRSPFRFSKKLTNNGQESIEIMLNDMYSKFPLLKPRIVAGSVEPYVPSVIWVKYFDDYMNFLNKKGINSENDQFVFCWYEGRDIRIIDYEQLRAQTPIRGVVMEEDLVGNLGALIQDVPVFKYEFMTESNLHNRKGFRNTTYVSSSNEKNGSYIEVRGDGSEFMQIDRSCIYREMTYANGFEEINRALVMNQYDAYAKFRTFGDMRLKPSVCMTIEDDRKAIKEVNIIDDVLYEFTPITSFTHVHLLTTNESFDEIEVPKILNADNENYPYVYGESKSNNYSKQN